MKKFPTSKQLKMLKEKGWRRACRGLAWQSPYDRYFYSPQAAVVREELLHGNKATQLHPGGHLRESEKGNA